MVWPVLLWGPVCQKSLEAESHHPLRNEGFTAVEGPRASWYVEDEYLYTVLKLALFLRFGLIICVDITNSSSSLFPQEGHESKITKRANHYMVNRLQKTVYRPSKVTNQLCDLT